MTNNKISYYLIAGLSHQLLKLVMCACAKQHAAQTHTQHARTHTYTASMHIHSAYTHRTHTQISTNMHGNAHTRAHTHTPQVKTQAATHTGKRTHTRVCTHTRTRTSRIQRKGSDTLAEVIRYVFKHNGFAIDTRAGKTTHTHTPQRHSSRSDVMFIKETYYGVFTTVNIVEKKSDHCQTEPQHGGKGIVAVCRLLELYIYII